jgi:hypothetical protein
LEQSGVYKNKLAFWEINENNNNGKESRKCDLKVK